MRVSPKSNYDVRGGIYHQLGDQNPWFLPKKSRTQMLQCMIMMMVVMMMMMVMVMKGVRHNQADRNLNCVSYFCQSFGGSRHLSCLAGVYAKTVSHTETILKTRAFMHRCFYTNASHKDAFTQNLFYTGALRTRALHMNASTVRAPASSFS